METKDWITIVSVVALIAGWFINGILNRRNEIAKRRFEYRMIMHQSWLKLRDFISKNPNVSGNDPTFMLLINDAITNFQLYGQDDEIKLAEEIVIGIQRNEIPRLNNAINKLAPLIVKRIRDELYIDGKYQMKKASFIQKK